MKFAHYYDNGSFDLRGWRLIKAYLVPKTKNFTRSYRMFGHMHGLLNVGKKKQLHRLCVNCETILLSLIAL